MIKIIGIKEDIEERIQRFINGRNGAYAMALHETISNATKLAQEEFQKAEYDGVNDVTVENTGVSKGGSKIIASGSSVTFIEFGAGITFNSVVHPLLNQTQFNIGGYGLGKGNQEFWYFKKQSNATFTTGKGVEVHNHLKNGQPISKTYGNRPNMCMYNARNYIIDNFKPITEKILMKKNGVI